MHVEVFNLTCFDILNTHETIPVLRGACTSLPELHSYRDSLYNPPLARPPPPSPGYH